MMRHNKSPRLENICPTCGSIMWWAPQDWGRRLVIAFIAALALLAALTAAVPYLADSSLSRGSIEMRF